MIRSADKFTMPRRYELISSVIRNNILSGRLPPGFVLLEGPIASLTQSSRAPVQAALRILEKERLVRRFPGRGYLVAPDGAEVEPLRGDIRELDLQISGEIDEALQNRGTWEMVYDTVEEHQAGPAPRVPVGGRAMRLARDVAQAALKGHWVHVACRLSYAAGWLWQSLGRSKTC